MFPHRNISFVRRYYKIILEKYCARFYSINLCEWQPTIGLEIHAQICTQSKLFSGASTDFKNLTNCSASLFDCAIPGTLPVLNRKCVEAAVLTGLALSCHINAVSMFERKHYFYPDMPAGFQITQQKQPLAVNGRVKFTVYKTSKKDEPYTKCSVLKQIQLEQDSGKTLHDEQSKRSLIDLNRAGLPLMEFVFQPDLSSGEEAAALVTELCFILQILGTCSCKMEEGALRVDANVSVSEPGKPLGTRTELKNISSIGAVANAVDYEVNRQIAILKSGEKVVNETRAWNSVCKKTFVMREKEERHDYRFIPEMNLPLLRLHTDKNLHNKWNLVDVSSLKEQLPELPEQIRESLYNRGLSAHAYFSITSNMELFRLFYNILENGKYRKPQVVAQMFISEILAFLEEHKMKLSFCVDNQSYIEESLDLFQEKVISQPTFRKLLDELLSTTNKMPKQIVEEKDWFLISNEEELEKLCREVLEKNSKLVTKYKNGSKKFYKKFMREVSIMTNGRADMSRASKIMTRLLS